MWSYMHATELTHYGIIGMKWGVRKNRVSKASDKVTSLNEKRKQIQSDKGAATRAYINASKDLLYAKGKLKYETGNRDKDKTLKINGKKMMEEAKFLKKPESWYTDGIENRRFLYPTNLSSQDRKAINYLESERAAKHIKAQKIKGPLTTAAIGVGLTVGIGVGTEIIRSKGRTPISSFITKDNSVAIGKSAVSSFIDAATGMPISSLIFKK